LKKTTNQTVRSRTVILYLSVSMFILLTACKKKEHQLGINSYDQNLRLDSHQIDTFSLKTYTIADDSVYTSQPANVLLGKINHPQVGEYSGSFFSQVRLSGVNPNFGDPNAITVDSFILSLEYRGSSGYPEQQTVEVYELDQIINKDSSYLASSTLLRKNEDWVVNGSSNMTIDHNLVTVIEGDTVASQLRIKLDPQKALKIIQDAHDPQYKSFFADNNQFVEYLKGIHVKISDSYTPALNKGVMGYFDLSDSDSKLTIYYKESGTTKAPFSLVFNNDCIRFNHFEYNNSGTQLAALLSDSTRGQNEFYALAGKYRGVIELESVKNLPKNIVIYSAQLILPVQHHPQSKFGIPQQIILTDKNIANYLATYDPLIRGYRTDNILPFIQNLITKTDTEPRLTIAPRSFISSAENIQFNGIASDKKMKPKLTISYTKF